MNPSFLLENGPVRLKQCRYGPTLYLSTDHYVGRSLDRYGEFSEGEMEVLFQLIRPGAVVLEVGANMGSHTIGLARAAGPTGMLLAFEPQRILFQILCANVALNALTNVHTHHAAVGRETGTIHVPILDPTANQNFGSLSLEGRLEGDPVALITIDSLKLPACNLIKIDVEGMESEVLAGAVQTIRRFRPVVYLENDKEGKTQALIQQLFALGYRLYWHRPPMFNPGNYFEATENIFGNVISINMLCLDATFEHKLTGFQEIVHPGC
jgi:FkbM family methyltransferase